MTDVIKPEYVFFPKRSDYLIGIKPVGTSDRRKKVWIGCWHYIGCPLRIEEVTYGELRKSDYNLSDINEKIKNFVEPKHEATRNTEECHCTTPSVWHAACCVLSTTCPCCGALDRKSRYDTEQNVKPMIGSDNFFARSLYNTESISYTYNFDITLMNPIPFVEDTPESSTSV